MGPHASSNKSCRKKLAARRRTGLHIMRVAGYCEAPAGIWDLPLLWQFRGRGRLLRCRMRIRISHETRYRYDAPTNGVIQTLRLTPRNHDGHYVVRWRIDVTEDCRLDEHEDAFGNITHTFTAEGPFAELRVQVEGEIDVQDTAGIVRGTIERFPPSLYLRATPLTEADGAIADFAREVCAQADDALPRLHALLARVHSDMVFDTDPTHTATTAAEAFALKRGVCQDLTHVFITAARHLGIPARYVGGYFHRADGVVNQEAGHAWA